MRHLSSSFFGFSLQSVFSLLPRCWTPSCPQRTDCWLCRAVPARPDSLSQNAFLVSQSLPSKLVEEVFAAANRKILPQLEPFARRSRSSHLAQGYWVGLLLDMSRSSARERERAGETVKEKWLLAVGLRFSFTASILFSCAANKAGQRVQLYQTDTQWVVIRRKVSLFQNVGCVLSEPFPPAQRSVVPVVWVSSSPF